MQLASNAFLYRCAQFILAAGMVSTSLAQNAPANNAPAAPVPQPDYAKPLPTVQLVGPSSHFPNPIAPYAVKHLSSPNLSNTPRIQSLMRDGKLYLSLEDAITLALENNLDIEIARYNLNIADTDILRAKSGSSILGTPIGVIQNTPGSGVGGVGGLVGSGTGGTNPGVGGAGAGALGLTSSTLGLGSPIGSFDPVITGTLQEDHNNTLVSTFFQGGAPGSTIPNNTGTVDFSYNQAFQWGSNLSVGFNNTRSTTNSIFTTYSPQLNSSFKATLTQHLLQGFGFAPNTRFIRIARNNRRESDAAFHQQIIASVDQIENMYWDLVYAYENLRVKRESAAFSQKTLSDTQKQVEIGSLAPIEVVKAKASSVEDERQVTLAQTNLQLQQLLMKNALSRTLNDSALAGAEVIPTSTMQVPASEDIPGIDDLVNSALKNRPDLLQSRIDLQNRELSNQAVRNALRPTLDLFAYYSGQGLGGAQNPANLCSNQTIAQQTFGECAGPNATTVPPGQTIIPISPTVGYSSTLNQLVNSTAPDKGVGLQLNIPLRNRAAQAAQIRSEIEYRQAQLQLQQAENKVTIDVRNSQFTLTQNRAAVDSARAGVDYARQNLDAEQKKFQFGTSTTTNVLQVRSALASAESTLLSAEAAYAKSRLDLERATGQLLEHSNISIDDAVRGQVSRAPTVQYVVPSKEAAPAQQQ